MCLMPIAILNLYFYFTDRQPYGDDLKLLRLSRGSSIVVFMISYFLLALRKWEKIISEFCNDILLNWF